MIKNLIQQYTLVLILLGAAQAIPLDASAQETKKVLFTGTVVDALTKQPLESVTIRLEATAQNVKTDRSGNFQLTVAQNPPFQVSASRLGYLSGTFLITSSPATIELEQSTEQLDEVVVVGYGSQRRRDFTGSAASISNTEIKDAPVQSFDQALVGKASGVSVAVPNGLLNNPPVIRIRGLNSISLSAYPLIVIDGIPVNSGNISPHTAVPNNPLADINPSDIESIDVLKDAASTSIYGSRAAGGVLIITTKQGKEGRARVNYDNWVSLVEPARLPRLLNADQYITIKNEAVLNNKILSGNASNNDVAAALFFPSFDGNGNPIETNWYDHVYNTGVSHSHSLSISGGNVNTKYYLSANLSDQEGFFAHNKFDRRGVRFNLDHTVNDWLSVGSNLSYNNTLNDAQSSGSLPRSQLFLIGGARLATALPPNVAVYNPDGSYNLNSSGLLGSGANLFSNSLYNPAALFAYSKYTTANDHLIGNIHADIRLLENLRFRTVYATDRNLVTTKTYLSPLLGSSSYSNGGQAANVHATLNNWNFTNTLSYEQQFAETHNLSLLAGYDIQRYHVDAWGASQRNASDPFFENYQGNWGSITTSGNDLNERLFRSTFFRLSYNYDSKYFLTGNFRRDGNSALGRNNKYGDFGGISVGWSLFEEEFYKSSPLADWLGDARFRASWGKVGNGNIEAAYGSLNLYSSSLYGNAPTWAPSQTGNPDLAWETSEQTNVGASLVLLRRFNLDVDYFRNNVNGLILSTPQAPSKGVPGNSILNNVGSMYNQGVEFALGGELVRNERFSWNSSLNFTHVKNKVTALSDNNADIIGYTHTTTEANNVTRVGHSAGSLFGAITDGVNPENGRRVFINRDGERVQYSAAIASGESNWTYLDGTVAPAITVADYQILGNALPTWYGGFNNSFRYRNFDAGLNFSFSGGNKIMNGTRGTLLDQRFYNNSTEVLDRWTTPGQITNIPRVVYNDVISNGSAGFSIDENAENADFLRLQNLLIGYTFDGKLLTTAGLSTIRAYAQASNLFVLTSYSGTDPESSSNGNSNTAMGVEKNSIGLGRTFTVGLNVSF